MELRFSEVNFSCVWLSGVQVCPLHDDVITSMCVHSGASIPVHQHAIGQRLPPTGSAGGSSGGHRAELRGAGGGDGAAIGPRPHPASTHHFLRSDCAAVQRSAQ